MIEAPSGISGSAFCTVNSTPLTLTLKMESNSSSVMFPSTAYRANPRIREENVETLFLALDLRVEPVEIAGIRHISAYSGRISPQFVGQPLRVLVRAGR